MPKGYPKDVLPPTPLGPHPSSVEPQPPPFIFTGFQPLSTINGKNVASAFAKSEHQSWWSRRANDEIWEGQRHWKKTVMLGGDDSALLSVASKTNQDDPNGARVSNTGPAYPTQPTITDPAQRTIVIHPGSSTVRIGRASDPLPISIPNVVARRRSPTSNNAPASGVFRNLEPTPTPDAFETFTSKTNAIRTELRSRMRAIKLRGITNGQGIAANYNADVAPLTLSEDQDPFGTTWPAVTSPEAKDTYVGEDALLIADAEKNAYAVRWPIKRGVLNTSEDSGYRTKHEILADIEAVWLHALSSCLGIKEQDLKEYSAIFILPDLYDHVYLREMVDLLFRALGFKQICLQQESLCACFGAGLGTACVIDIGASKTSISCVDEGWVIPDTRLQLAFGGDDITAVLAGMLRRQNFPYKQLNLNCTWDWQMMEQLKEDMLVLSEGDVGLNSYTFFSRHPHQPTLKWSVRAYDEVIIPAMVMFSPSIVDFDRKFKSGRALYSDKDSLDDVLDLGGNAITEAMRNSTGISVFIKANATAPTSSANGVEVNRPSATNPDEATSIVADDAASPYSGTPQPTVAGGLESNTPTRRPSPNLPGPAKPISNALVSSTTVETTLTPSAAFLAAVSKIPLHEAVVQSILACGTEEKCKRMAGAIMLVGGGGLIHNIGYAVTTRIQPMLTARYPNIGEASTIPPPRDVDPRVLAWKGVSLLCRLEAASDLWIRSSDWEVLGSKAIKDRTMFIC